MICSPTEKPFGFPKTGCVVGLGVAGRRRRGQDFRGEGLNKMATSFGNFFHEKCRKSVVKYWLFNFNQLFFCKISSSTNYRVGHFEPYKEKTERINELSTVTDGSKVDFQPEKLQQLTPRIEDRKATAYSWGFVQ